MESSVRTPISINVTWFKLVFGVTPLELIPICAPQASVDTKSKDPRCVDSRPREGIEHTFVWALWGACWQPGGNEEWMGEALRVSIPLQGNCSRWGREAFLQEEMFVQSEWRVSLLVKKSQREPMIWNFQFSLCLNIPIPTLNNPLLSKMAPLP